MSAIQLNADDAGKTILLYSGAEDALFLKRVRYEPFKEQKIAVTREELQGIAEKAPEWLASLSNADAPTVDAATPSPSVSKASQAQGNSPSSPVQGNLV